MWVPPAHATREAVKREPCRDARVTVLCRGAVSGPLQISPAAALDRISHPVLAALDFPRSGVTVVPWLWLPCSTGCRWCQAVHSSRVCVVLGSHLSGAARGEDSHPVLATSCLLGQDCHLDSAWFNSLQGHPGLTQGSLAQTCCLGRAEPGEGLNPNRTLLGSTGSDLLTPSAWKVVEGRARSCSPWAGSGVCLVQVPCEGLATSTCRAVPGLMDPSPSCLRASTSHGEVTGRSRVSCPMEGVCWVAPMHPTSLGARGQVCPVSPAPCQGHCSTAGTKSGVGRGHGSASLLSCGAWGTPIPGRAGEGMAGLAIGWGRVASCQRHPQLCGEPPAPSWLPLLSPSCLAEL